MTCNPLIFLINFKSNGSNGVLGYTGSSTSWKPLICWEDVHDCQFQYNILFEVTKWYAECWTSFFWTLQVFDHIVCKATSAVVSPYCLLLRTLSHALFVWQGLASTSAQPWLKQVTIGYPGSSTAASASPDLSNRIMMVVAHLPCSLLMSSRLACTTV